MSLGDAVRADEYRRAGWWSETRIFDLFDAAVRSSPETLAVIDPPNRAALVGGAPGRLTFATLDRLVIHLMNSLSDAGLRSGDILVTQLPNIAEYIAVYLAAMKLGVVLSPVPMQFRRRELQHIAGLTQARGLLTVPRFRDADPFEEARPAVASTNCRLLSLGVEAPPDTIIIEPSAPIRAIGQPPPAYQPDCVRSDQIATICWTSGTEGVPKGVPRTHNHWLAISHGHFQGAGIHVGDRLLNPIPLVNMAAIGGCFLSWLHAAGTLILHHPFDLDVFLAQIADERPAYTFTAPATLNQLLKDEQLRTRADLSSLRRIGSGSAPLDSWMIRGYRDHFGIEVINCFGSNEGMTLFSSAVETPDPEMRARLFPRFGRSELHWPRRYASAIETRIVDPGSGTEIFDTGHPGEMQIRGPTVFDGYFRAPEINSHAFANDGWFRTGDLFELAGDDPVPRYYRFVGRLKQVIVRGGLKISPDEVETVLAQHPAIAEAAVVGVRDEVLGERVGAILVMRPGTDQLTLSAVQDHCRAAGIAIYKWPERLCFTDALPRNPVGKVVRSGLSAIADP